VVSCVAQPVINMSIDNARTSFTNRLLPWWVSTTYRKFVGKLAVSS
jgi:hypothetical protein